MLLVENETNGGVRAGAGQQHGGGVRARTRASVCARLCARKCVCTHVCVCVCMELLECIPCFATPRGQ